MNLRYSLKATDLSARLFASFENYRAKQAGSVLHNQATGGQDVGKVASKAGPDMMNGGRFVRRSNKENKTRVNVNGNGQHA